MVGPDVGRCPQCLSSLNTEGTEDLSKLSVEALLGAEDTESIVKEENK